MASRGSTLGGEPLIVYENLARLCEFRGARVISRVRPEDFTKTMEADHLVQMKAERTADPIRGAADITIVQFSTWRDIDSNSTKFRAALDKIVRAGLHPVPSADREHNIILITSAPVSTTIESIIADANKDGTVVEQYVASMFLIVVPEHSCVPRHTIVPRAEVDTMCKRMHMSVSNFPVILSSDPVAVWLGIRAGMIVRIDRPSETALIETVYRRCV